MTTKKETKEKITKINDTDTTSWGTKAIQAATLGLAPFIGLHAFPVVIGVMVYTEYDKYKGKQDLLDKPMSDDWLKRVSEDKDISTKGLAFLARKIEKNGFVSIDEANDWLKIETVEAAKKEEELLKKEIVDGDGAISLLRRAKDTTDIFDDISIDSAIDEIKKVSSNISSFFKIK